MTLMSSSLLLQPRNGFWAAILWSVASRIYPTLHVAFLCSSYLIFLNALSLSTACVDRDTAWKKTCFILSHRSKFNIIDNLSIAVHTFIRHMLTSLSAVEILLLRYVNLSTNFRCLPLKVEIAPFGLKHINSYLCSHRGQCLLQVTPDYTAGIRLGQVYLRKAVDHLVVSVCYSFCRTSSASCFFVSSNFLLLDPSTLAVVKVDYKQIWR